MNKKTIDYYNKNADEFYKSTINADMSFQRERFISYLPKGGYILDAGCGSGRDSKVFKNLGFFVEAFDASSQLCERASNLLGQNVRLLTFEEMDYEDEFDGIWACASLIHVFPNDLKDVVKRLANALHKSGILYASFKRGHGETLRGERRFTDATKEDVVELFSSSFDIIELDENIDVRLDRVDEYWVNVIAKKHV